MDRRTVLAVVLSFLIFFAWQKFYIEPRLPKKVPQTTQSQSVVAEKQTPTLPETPKAAKVPPQERDLVVSTGIAKVGNGNKVVTGWDLKSFKLGISPEAAAVDLKSVTHQEGEIDLAFDHPDLAYLANVRGNFKETPEGLVWEYEDQNVRVSRLLSSSGEKPYVDLLLDVKFKTAKPKYAFVSLISQGVQDDSEERDRNLLFYANSEVERTLLKDAELRSVMGPVKWIAVSSRYFLMSVVAEEGSPQALVQRVDPLSARVSLVYPVSGDSIRIPVKAFFGPKDLSVLKNVDPTLDLAVDLGFFSLIAYPLLQLMKWFNDLAHNWGVAIILLTLLVRLVTFPLTYKSMKSMKNMAKLQPQLQKIREKYKDDREALNREMLTLMRTHGYNPMAGCLPILIQMPIFFALYQVLYSAVELYHAPFMLWIQDLSSKDPYFVTPVLLSVTMWIQQKLTPNTATDPMQAKMLQLMPLIFGAFMLTLPSGLTLYMLVSAIAGIVQQIILNKKFDTRNVTAVPARAR